MLEKDNTALWEDIKSLYSDLNATADKFGMSQSTVPEHTNEDINVTDITDLKTLVQALTANEYIGDTADTSGVDTPVKGEIITPLAANQLGNIIDQSYEKCIHDASYNASYNTSYNSSYFASYNSSYNTSQNSSYDMTYCGSYNNSYFATCFSYNNGYFTAYNTSYNSSYFASYRTSYNTSYFSSCYSQCSGGSFSFTGSYS